MIYLLGELYVFVLAAFAVGIVIGWLSCDGEQGDGEPYDGQ